MFTMVWVEVIRAYPRGGVIHEIGTQLRIPDYAVSDATKGRRPFVRVLDPREIVLDADFDATEGALDLARAIEFDLTPYSGQGTLEGGRIQKPDVERWAKEKGLIPETKG